MARKSTRALAAAAAESTSSSGDERPTGKVAVSDLAPKSCLTCARVITPRAKWAKDWAAIKYCSDRCRSTRPGKVVVRFRTKEDPWSLEKSNGVKIDSSAPGGEVEASVDVETFVEGVILEIARSSRRDDLACLEDVQDRIKDLLGEASIEFASTSNGQDVESDADNASNSSKGATAIGALNAHPLWKALDSPPGFRERVRRAARRLALGITHDSDAHQTNIVTAEHGRIELIQAGKSLRTVQDLSFAKGVIHIRSKD